MTGKTIKQIFQIVKNYNNVCDILNDLSKHKINIYIDESRFYTGTEYKTLLQRLESEYITDFVNEITNTLICGTGDFFINVNGTEHHIEIYLLLD